MKPSAKDNTIAQNPPIMKPYCAFNVNPFPD